MKLIGIVGSGYGCGKSTVASFIASSIGPHRVEVIPFAKALKDLARDLGWNGKKDEKGRQILQHLGTEVCRNIDPDYWIARWKSGAGEILNNGLDMRTVIVDDVRFENEIEAIRELGGFTIYINRPHRSKWVRFWKRVKHLIVKSHRHASEGNIVASDCDYVIENCISLEELQRLVGMLLSSMAMESYDGRPG